MDAGAMLVAGLEQENVSQWVHSFLRAWSRGVRPEAPEEYRATNRTERGTNRDLA